MSPYTRDEAWAIARSLSPRDTIRVAARAASGEVLNDYHRLVPLDGPAPSTTWAMLLAGDDQLFRYLCFDFDTSQGNAARDALRMAYWLDELNIPHLTCISGPSGGRHVWVRLSAPADAAAVRDLADYAHSILPTLDTKPLQNAAAGCVRPPYAPHRESGFSDPQGDLGLISSHEAPADTVKQLTALLIDLGAELPATETELPKGAITDAAGNPKIMGVKRRLSMAMEDTLRGPAGPDASHTLSRVLIAAANARWSYDDIVEAVATGAAGLEHARTRRVGDKRVKRTPASTAKVLRNIWNYAVRFVATHPLNATGDDPEYRERIADVTTVVQQALAAADAVPGLWAARNPRVGGTRSQRAVLDALCLYMLQSSRHIVEADVRRLSADTGYGRTTVSDALRALCGTWITRVAEAEGVHAARYALAERFSPGEEGTSRTQARMRAEHKPTLPLQQNLIHEIGTRLELLRHDVFTAPHSLGRTSGLIFQHLPEDGTLSTAELMKETGIDADLLRRRLRRLHASGLIERIRGGWRRYSPGTRDLIAKRLGVDGYLEERRKRYELERAVWAWWQAEVVWMERRFKKRKGAKAIFVGNDRPDFVAYPRGPSKRGDHRRARELVLDGILDRELVLAA
ncbi:DeoR family transcriptional regulator [Microbacterium sp. 77mftsu3.1]|uniref:DeoR family transcriptional regulator n=1 Tax=Microbacterium sp. 77mftsu3.1 TaxID=1761802 RepID=UPI0003704EB5|nr:DeoR family transcriptional regulator [Microbacterium sp. 77mftsu3.1]